MPTALVKAERYRLLNQPREAESICRDVLRTDAENQQGIIVLLLALTDQFGQGFGVHVEHAQRLLPRILDEYEREYYAGVILERWAKTHLDQGTPRYVVHDWLRNAMSAYERAEGVRPPENDDAILRWNACARLMHGEMHGAGTETQHAPTGFTGEFDDEVPVI